MRLGDTVSGSTVQAMVAATAQQMGIDPALALAVAKIESNFNPNAVSSAGAIGVMQLMPATAAQMGVNNPRDAQQNITGGLRYLSMLISQFGGDVSKALAAYNWGPGNVANVVASKGVAWFSGLPGETQNYVVTICGQANCPGSAFADPTQTATPGGGASVPVPTSGDDWFSASAGPLPAETAPAWDAQTLFLLAIGAIGVYILADSL